jgi:hypothetical protein
VNIDELLEGTRSWDRTHEIETWDERVQLGHFHDSLVLAPPQRVRAVLAVAPLRRNKARAPFVPLVTIARFRTEYSVIEAVARSIAPAILTTGIVPIIQPVREGDIEELYDDAPFLRRLTERGIRVWDSTGAS